MEMKAKKKDKIKSKTIEKRPKRMLPLRKAWLAI